MTNPTIDIILPIYKPDNLVFKAIDSVLHQTYTNWHLYIINDASEDDSLINIKSHYQYNLKISFFELLKNQRPAACRNFGVKQGKGIYIAFIDQDDFWLPNKLDIQVKYLILNPEVEAVHGNIKIIDNEGNVFKHQYWQKENNNRRKCHWTSLDKISTARQLFINPNIRLISSMISRNLFERINGFKENFFGGEDELFWFEVALNGKIGYVDDYLFYRGEHQNNTVNKFELIRKKGYYKTLFFIKKEYKFIIEDLFSLKEQVILKSITKILYKNKKYFPALFCYGKLMLKYPLATSIKTFQIFIIKFHENYKRHLFKNRTKMGLHK